MSERDRKKKDQEVVNPLDFFDWIDEEKEGGEKPAHQPAKPVAAGGGRPLPQPARPGEKQHQPAPSKRHQGFFISGTDTGVGKTMATCALGLLLKAKGLDVGVMKPFQCGGNDAKILKETLNITDDLAEINLYSAAAPAAPNIAFRREKVDVQMPRVIAGYRKIRDRHDLTMVEGVGGIMVPITDNYLVLDLIRELDLELVIVARLGLGTINHALLTIDQARMRGIKIKGMIFCEASEHERGLAEQTNPQTIGRLGQVHVLGTIPYIKEAAAGPLTMDHLNAHHVRLDIRPFTEVMTVDKTKLWMFWDKKFIWHPFTQMKDWQEEEAPVIERAQGNQLIDTQGKHYIDGVSSLWVNVHGHGHPRIDNELHAQIGKLSHSTFLGLTHTPGIELAKRLTEICPPGLQRVFYSDNGSTAVEVALKMAYQYWQNTGKPKKTLLAHLANAYHGDTLGSVSVGGIALFHQVYRQLIFSTLALEFPDFYRAPEGKSYPTYAEECLNKMEEVFKTRHEEIAALIVEPLVQGAAGMVVWPDGILKRLRALCDQYQILLIADEVATGFGRTGKMFACEHEGVSPDFLCLAKGLTGGYLPLAATMTTRRIYEGFLFDYREQKTFFHGHTYTANPLACAAALANLDIFEKEKILRRLVPRIEYLADRLTKFREFSHVGDVRQKGFMVGIELVQDKATKAPYPWEEKVGVKVCQKVRSRGVILRPLGNVIVLMPPLSIRRDEMDRLLDTTAWAIQQVTGA